MHPSLIPSPIICQVPSLARCSSTEDLVVSKAGRDPVLTGDTNEKTKGW